LSGIDSHETRIVIPIFDNDQNIARLAKVVDDYLDQHGDIHAYVIGGHGFYTWGSSVATTLRYLEALEFLFECELRLQGMINK
jgi:methylthioribulose-1-phosphate dehydratase